MITTPTPPRIQERQHNQTINQGKGLQVMSKQYSIACLVEIDIASLTIHKADCLADHEIMNTIPISTSPVILTGIREGKRISSITAFPIKKILRRGS